MSKAKILLVSNDVLTGRLWLDQLSQNGYSVFGVSSADEGLAYAAREEFDLAIVDVGDPALAGITLCRRLRSKETKFILLLGYIDTDEYMLVAFEAGVDGYLVKPISPCLFLARVRAVLRRL